MNMYEEALNQLSDQNIKLAENLLKLQESVHQYAGFLAKLAKFHLELRLDVDKLKEEVK